MTDPQSIKIIVDFLQKLQFDTCPMNDATIGLLVDESTDMLKSTAKCTDQISLAHKYKDIVYFELVVALAAFFQNNKTVDSELDEKSKKELLSFKFSDEVSNKFKELQSKINEISKINKITAKIEEFRNSIEQYVNTDEASKANYKNMIISYLNDYAIVTKYLSQNKGDNKEQQVSEDDTNEEDNISTQFNKSPRQVILLFQELGIDFTKSEFNATQTAILFNKLMGINVQNTRKLLGNLGSPDSKQNKKDREIVKEIVSKIKNNPKK